MYFIGFSYPFISETSIFNTEVEGSRNEDISLFFLKKWSFCGSSVVFTFDQAWLPWMMWQDDLVGEIIHVPVM